jgi:hypothetical protein
MMKIRGWAFVVCFSLSLAAISSSASAASSEKFKNCTKLLEKYFWGVGLNRVAVADGYKIIEIRPKVYMANKHLDVDKDGVACEDESVQYRPAVTTTTTSSTTTTTTIPTAPIAPTLLVATIRSPFDGTGTLTWTDNSNNEENFYISNVDPAGLTGQPLSTIWYKASKNQTAVSITGYQNGYTYCYWGMASNAFGNSGWSGPVCSLAGTATTTTTAYVPPTTAYVPSYGGGGGGSSSNWLGCYFKGKKMWGNVYIASSSWSADFDVYVTSSSWSADLRVYQPSSSWSANSCGHWYITTSSWNADFSVYLTSSSWSSDFSIYLTTSSWNAGR